MNIESVPIETLVFDPSNARLHDAKNLDAIKGSLMKFGQVEPLVVRRHNRVVLGGNGRLAGMLALGWKKASVFWVDLTDTQAKALALALNRTGELASWDKDTLAGALRALQDDEFALDEIGFDDFDVKAFLGDLDIGGDDSGSDKKGDKTVECPHCGEVFTPSKKKKD